jgi:hypothetical protein
VCVSSFCSKVTQGARHSERRTHRASHAHPGPTWQVFERAMQVLPQAFPLVQYLQHTFWATRKGSVPQKAGVGRAMRGNDSETATTSAQASSVRPGFMASALQEETGARGSFLCPVLASSLESVQPQPLDGPGPLTAPGTAPALRRHEG